MRLQIAIVATAMMLSVTLASAQLSGGVGNSSGGHSSGGGLGGPANPSVPPSLGVSPGAQAPVGHFQPRRDAATDDGIGNQSAEERALDRKIRGICRGC